MRFGYFAGDRRKREQRGVPVEYVHVDFIFLARSDSPVGGRDGASASTVDGVSVLGEPFADGVQAGDELRIDFAVGIWADVHQQIRIAAGGADQAAFEVGGTFIVAVADDESPIFVERVATFERKRGGDVVSIESSGVLAGKIALERLDVFSRFWRLMMIGNDE